MREYPQQLTLFTEDSLVSRSVWQETRKGRTIPVISGLNFRVWSEKLDRVGLSLKTLAKNLESCTSQLTTIEAASQAWNSRHEQI